MIQAGGQDKTPGQILDPNGKPLSDITDRSSRMPRNSTILYRTPSPRSGADPAHYRGMLRLRDGRLFWIGGWFRTVNGQTVLELRLTPRDGEMS
jgi:hypothetical protein